MRAVVISLGGPGNERCLEYACAPGEERPSEQVTAALQDAADSGARRVVLVGGEPTARRDLASLVGRAGALGLAVTLVTNGRMLLYPRLRNALLERGVDRVRLLIHGGSAAIHDAMVGVPGAFSQAHGALEALLSAAAPLASVEAACVVTAQNRRHLGGLVRLLVASPRHCQAGLRFMAPEQGPDSPGDARLVAEALDLARELDPELDLAWEGFPPDALPRHADLREEWLRHQLLRGGPRGGKANSFNLERLRELGQVTVRADGCAAQELDLDDPARHLLLVEDGQVSLLRTPTRDFTEQEIRAVKEQTEQLYLDTSPDAAMDELARHVRRARAHPECLVCPWRRRCCGAVTVEPGDPFVGEEAWLKRALSELRGEVLDVGCGEQPYRQLLADLAGRGAINYHGLDPDAGALQRLRELGAPGGQLHHGDVESFTGHEAAFDHVTGLRAVNHLRDLDRGLAVMVAALRPGGTLLLSDMTVYGLLRTPAQVGRADRRGGAHPQHFRNLTSQGCLDALASHPLELLEHRPVTRETSNEWFLLLRKAAEDHR